MCFHESEYFGEERQAEKRGKILEKSPDGEDRGTKKNRPKKMGKAASGLFERGRVIGFLETKGP